MTRTWLVVLAALPVLAAACQGNSPAPWAQDPGPARRCAAPAGSRTDVAGEPGWRRYADYRRWTTADGCLVRADVVADLDGPEHCGWQDARTITMGTPAGAGRIPQGGGRTYGGTPATS